MEIELEVEVEVGEEDVEVLPVFADEAAAAETPWLRLAGRTLAFRMRWASAKLTGGMLARNTPGAGANSLLVVVAAPVGA
ncbi:hypothetical protein [Variovorax soli]|uniref:Uncharacterized protein n=1 Tax=Variovorax soli TaxID=376815 RepID=A0ABU1NFC0_9BURK|nr:hypothetical protein [Variovorax soli]MDR6537124.1 hypothetical protein [Variovorax soli]